MPGDPHAALLPRCRGQPVVCRVPVHDRGAVIDPVSDDLDDDQDPDHNQREAEQSGQYPVDESHGGLSLLLLTDSGWPLELGDEIADLNAHVGDVESGQLAHPGDDVLADGGADLRDRGRPADADRQGDAGNGEIDIDADLG